MLAAFALAACASKPPPADPLPAPADVRQRADLAWQYGDYSAAVDNYRRLLAQQPGDRAALLGLGQAWLALGNADNALPAFEEVLRQDPESIDAQEGRALAQLGQGKQVEAESGFRAVLALDAQRWRSLDGLGLLADLRSNYDAARGFYEKALAINKNEATVWNNYGWSRVMARDYADGERLLNEGLARKPDSRRLVANLSVAIAWQGDYDRALRTATQHGIEDYVAYNDVGYIAMLRGDNRAAVDMFRKALDKSPAWYERASVNLERAQKALRDAPP